MWHFLFYEYAMNFNGFKRARDLKGKKILAIDYGTKNVGLAHFTPGNEPYPIPFEGISYPGDQNLINWILTHLDDEVVEVVVKKNTNVKAIAIGVGVGAATGALIGLLTATIPGTEIAWPGLNYYLYPTLGIIAGSIIGGTANLIINNVDTEVKKIDVELDEVLNL